MSVYDDEAEFALGADGSWWYLVQQRGITGMTGSGVHTWAAAYAICLMYVDRFRREYR